MTKRDFFVCGFDALTFELYCVCSVTFIRIPYRAYESLNGAMLSVISSALWLLTSPVCE